jgi:V/A-type H+-transporting ATPase subunit A
LREGFLQQNAMDEIDAYSTVQKQICMLDLILYFHKRARRIISKGAPIVVIHDLPAVNVLIRMKSSIPNSNLTEFDVCRKQIDEQMNKLEEEY